MFLRSFVAFMKNLFTGHLDGWKLVEQKRLNNH